jgi:hypothetical protein
MAMGWIKQIWNGTDSTFTLRQNDPSWRPIQDLVMTGPLSWAGRKYEIDEAITVPPRIKSRRPVPWIPFEVPVNPPMLSNMKFEYFIIPWAESGRLLIDGPGGSAEIVIGPTSATSDDFLRFLDPQTRLEFTPPVEIGPRGGGWVASVDFHLIFNTLDAKGALFQVWAAHAGGDAAMKAMLEAAKAGLEVAGGALFKKLLGIK